MLGLHFKADAGCNTAKLFNDAPHPVSVKSVDLCSQSGIKFKRV